MINVVCNVYSYSLRRIGWRRVCRNTLMGGAIVTVGGAVVTMGTKGHLAVTRK